MRSNQQYTAKFRGPFTHNRSTKRGLDESLLASHINGRIRSLEDGQQLKVIIEKE